jgi:hypothetical protein
MASTPSSIVISGVVLIAFTAPPAVAASENAAKHGKNPVFYGILALMSPVNLILLGYWVFVVIWVWNQIHRLNPRLVGGCRPVSLQDFLDEEQWQIDYHYVVTAFGIPSEVMVASKSVSER